MIVARAAESGKTKVPSRTKPPREEARRVVARLVALSGGSLTTGDRIDAPTPREVAR